MMSFGLSAKSVLDRPLFVRIAMILPVLNEKRKSRIGLSVPMKVFESMWSTADSMALVWALESTIHHSRRNQKTTLSVLDKVVTAFT